MRDDRKVKNVTVRSSRVIAAVALAACDRDRAGPGRRSARPPAATISGRSFAARAAAASRAHGPVPLHWSPTENIVWQTEIEGRGHSSPVVWGDLVFLTTAIEGEVVPGAKAPVPLPQGPRTSCTPTASAPIAATGSR